MPVATQAAGATERPGVPVGASVDAAIAEVFGWLDPDRRPRIDAVLFSTADDVSAACQAAHSSGIWDVHGDEPVTVQPDDLPDALIVIRASQDGMNSFTDYADERPLPTSQRERIAVLVDAASGDIALAAPISVGGGGSDVRCLADIQGRPRLPGATREPAATATTEPYEATAIAQQVDEIATAQVLPTPDGALPLRPDDVPEALKPVLRGYPVFPNNRWVWRRTDRFDDVRWHAIRYTETVKAAWVLGPERIAADFEITYDWLTSPALPDDRMLKRYRRYIDPRWSWRGGARESAELDAMGNPGAPNYPPSIPLSDYAPAEMPIESSHSYSLPPRFARHGGVDVLIPVRLAPELKGVGVAPGGAPCWTFSVLGGSGLWGTQRWFCPGFGYVRDESGGGNMLGSFHTLVELETADLRTVLAGDD